MAQSSYIVRKIVSSFINCSTIWRAYIIRLRVANTDDWDFTWKSWKFHLKVSNEINGGEASFAEEEEEDDGMNNGDQQEQQHADQEEEQRRVLPSDNEIVAWLTANYQAGNSADLIKKTTLVENFYDHFRLTVGFDHHFIVTRIGELVRRTFRKVTTSKPGTAGKGYRPPHYSHLKPRN